MAFIKEYSPYLLKKRLLAVVIAAGALLTVLFGRLAYVQIIEADKLQSRAFDQWTRDLPVTAPRGQILDRNGVVLADTNTSYTVYARPKELKDTAYAAAELARLLGEDETELLKKLLNRGVSEVTVSKKTDKEHIRALTALELKGVYVSSGIERVYPYGELMSQVLGYISSDNEGQSGLEKYYDKFLKGIDGSVLTESDLTGNRLDGSAQGYEPPIPGLNLVLTLDAGIQMIAENAMEQAMLNHNPTAARCIVMDPQTGEILAMVNKPGFDINDPPRDDLESLNKLSRNSLVVDIYEPGSTFKMFTVAANIEEYAKGNPNAFKPDHIYPSGKTRVVEGRIIKCWSTHANGKHANQDLGMALNTSCNPIFVDIALSLGKETYYKYMDAFRFNGATGIDFLGEGTGMVVPKAFAREGDLARMGFGQSIAVSPMQLAAAASAAVNGGKYMQPHLVREIATDAGITAQRIYPANLGRAISEQTSRTLAAMLEDVVANGSGKHAYIEGYRVGGKTGTAQKFENGAIAQGKYVSSFVGFFPAHNPQYLALVIVDEPQGANYGSIVAAPYAGMIFNQIISLNNIPVPA